MQLMAKTVEIWNQQTIIIQRLWLSSTIKINTYILISFPLFCTSWVQEPSTKLSKLNLFGKAIKTELLYAKRE